MVIAKEMTNVGVVFHILEHGENVPNGWSQVTGHIVFNVKMDFTRKACWVLDGHKTPNVMWVQYMLVSYPEKVLGLPSLMLL